MSLKLTRRHLLATSAAGTAALAAPRLAPAQADRPELRIGANGILNNLEPVNAISNVGVRIVNTMFDTLIRRDWFADGAAGNGTKLVPGLASEWTRENDRAVVVTLREGIRFHNGAPMTAEDVGYTFSRERLWGEEAREAVPFGRLQSPNWDDPEVIDDLTVRLRTQTPSPLIEEYLASWIGWVVPKAYYSELGADAFGRAPVGTGPYKFVELAADDRVVVEANDDYWGEQPTASRIVFQSVPERAARVAGLVAGDYDIVTTLTSNEIPLLEGRSGVAARGKLIENFHMFIFNMNKEPMSDPVFRKALALAVDRELINETLWNGLAEIPRGFNFPHYGETYEADRDFFEYDPDRAKELLAESAYDGEAVGVPIVANDYYANNTDAALMMVEMWKGIGVNIEMRDATGGSWPDMEQIGIRAWSNGMALTDAHTTIVSEFGPNGGVQQSWGWDAPERFNSLAELTTVTPQGEERLSAFSEMRDIFEEEMPAIPLYRPYDVYGVRSDIQWQPISFESMELRAHNLQLG